MKPIETKENNFESVILKSELERIQTCLAPTAGRVDRARRVRESS